MKSLVIVFLIFVANLNGIGQTITPSVINSGGSTNTVVLGVQPVIYTDNIGEVVVQTASNSANMLTQGFLQPDMIVVANTTVSVVPTDVSCADKADGYIRVIIDNLPTGANVQYYWMPNSLCPTNNCSGLDNLSAGSFSVLVKYTYTVGSNVKTDSTKHVVTIKDENGNCKIKVYNGIATTGVNSSFVIDNIEEFPEASVMIFNRWGKELFSTKSYNNKDNYWPRKNENVAAGTYFYIIDIGDGKPLKGWVEVLN